MTTTTLPHPAATRRPLPHLIGLLTATALLYLWGLADSGWANSFYAAAVQAGTHSWKAAFFGSSDASNFITVDKPPVALWVMELSARTFGLSSWSLLAPQALEGVAAVGLLYATVGRWFGPVAGLLAGAALALTPVAALMFRFDNPDALLTLLLVGAAYATIRALEDGSGRWLALASFLVGTGFLTKMLQAFLVVPAFALVYLLAAPNPLRARIDRLAAAAVALVVSSGWWVAVVQLIPAGDRPYIGGSQDNSLVNLIFGYNGFGRLTGTESGSVGGTGGGVSQWGPTGWERLFNADFGGQISWLIPAALIVLAAVLWMTRRAPRTDRTRAAFAMWGGWLVVTGLTFSFARGIVHPYYTVALAPAIAALVATGAVLLWRRRAQIEARVMLAGALAATAVWAFVLFGRTSSFDSDLRQVVLVAGLAAAGCLLAAPRLGRWALTAIAVAGIAAALAGPTAYTLDTVATAHAGAIPSAGPASARGFGGRPGGAGRPRGGQAAPPGFAAAAPGGLPGVRGGNPGGLLQSTTPSSRLTKLLAADAGEYRWVAAAVGSNTAAGYQLAGGHPVMAIGGFNGTDPAPTLRQFEQYVRRGEIHYFIAGGMGGGGQRSDATAITAWVRSHFTATTAAGTTLYDLSSGRS